MKRPFPLLVLLGALAAPFAARAVVLHGPLGGGSYGDHAAVRLEAQTLDEYGAARKHQLSVTAQSLMPTERGHGSGNLLLTLTDTRAARRELEVWVASEGSAAQTVVLEPSGTATLAFDLPNIECPSLYHARCEVHVREGGKAWEAGSVGPSTANDWSRLVNLLAGPEFDAIATVADYAREDEKADAADSSHRYKRVRFRFHTQAMGESGWRTETRAYTGYDIVLLTDREWAGLSAGVRRALAGYAAEGGALVLCGSADLPAEAAGFPSAPAKERGADRSFSVGAGRVVLLPALDAARKVPLARADLRELGQAAGRRLRAAQCADQRIDNLLKSMPPLELPVMPVSFFMLLLAFFALGVVPAVLVFLIRRKRRIQALLALPLVSLAIGVAIVLGILGFYGVTPCVSESTHVLLNAAGRRAVVFGRACVFSPRDVVDRLRFSPSAEIFVVGSSRTGYGVDEGRTLCLLPGAERKASGGAWLTPLKPVLYATVDVRDANARLAVEELAPDRVKVTNLLGAAVKSLELVDSRGQAFAAKDLAEGASCELTPSARPQRLYDSLGASLAACRGVFRAELAGSPFLTDTLGGGRAARSAETVVLGRYGREVAE